MDNEDMRLGPVDYALFEFRGNRFNGEIAPNILDLVEKGLITIFDLVFLQKDEDGQVAGIGIEVMNDSEIGSLSLFAGRVDELLSEEEIAEPAPSWNPTHRLCWWYGRTHGRLPWRQPSMNQEAS